MEALLQDFNTNQPTNLHGWLWLDGDLSDVSLTLAIAHAHSVSGSSAEASTTSTTPTTSSCPTRRQCNNKDAISTADPAGQEHNSAEASAPGCQVLDVHAIVLCSNSAYFRARITTAVGGSGSKRSRCETMTAEIEADQVQAATSVLRFFYTSQLTSSKDGACTPEFLLQMMQVADCWQAPAVLTAISTLLCKLPPELFPITAVYSLPGLSTSPAFADIAAHAEASLHTVFRDATAVATTQSLLGRFLELPHTAVLSLLQGDKLETDAEATVLLLLSEWCAGGLGQACTEKELRKLNGCIRYSRLSMPYLTELCASLHTPLLTLEERMELLHFRSLSHLLQAEMQEIDVNTLANPIEWYLPCRKAPGQADVRALKISLKVPEAEMSAFLQACKDRPLDDLLDISSKAIYAHGFLWSVRLERHKEGWLWFGVSVQGVSSLLADAEGIDLHLGIPCSRSTRVLGRTATQGVIFTTNHHSVINTCGMGGDCHASEGDALRVLERQWWQPYVLKGCISFVARVTDIGA